MTKLIGAVLLAMCSVFGFAVDGNQVAYIGGTNPAMKAGEIGVFITTSPSDLVFASKTGNAQIPYSSISRVEYRTEVARHLGVLPAIAVSLVKRREAKHFLNISYCDGPGPVQVATFELSKAVPATLLPILQARAPKAFGGSNAMVQHLRP